MTTKIGPQIEHTDNTGAMAWARHASIVKAIDAVDALQGAPDQAIRVFRHYFTDQEQNSLSGETAASYILNALGGYRHPQLYAEVYNEVAQSGDALHILLERNRAAAAVLHQAGVKVAAFSFSTGNPPAEADYALLATTTLTWADAVACHCYWGAQGFTPWHALRYRLLYAATRRPIIITECGRDRIEGGQGGWRVSGLSGDQYLAELSAYDQILSGDHFVLGATPFGIGLTDDWRDYDLSGLDVSRFYSMANIPQGGSTVDIPGITTLPSGEQVAQPWDAVGADVLRRLAALEERDAYLADADKQIIEGHPGPGPGTAAADVVALQGGRDDLTFPPPA